MHGAKAFEGFEQLVRGPLQQSDPRSYHRVLAVLERAPKGHAAPLAYLLNRLVGRKLSPEAARSSWAAIIELKARMEQLLGFAVDIQAAAVQHFAMAQADEALQSGRTTQVAAGAAHGLFASRHGVPDSPDYWLGRLKDEIQRSKRYSHALSAVLVDAAEELVDQPRHRQEQDLVLLGKVVEDTVRTVDILTPCAPFRFLVLLPDTNLREAQELASRVRANVARRTARAHRTDKGLQVRLGAAQWEESLSASAFFGRLELVLSRVDARAAPRTGDPG